MDHDTVRDMHLHIFKTTYEKFKVVSSQSRKAHRFAQACLNFDEFEQPLNDPLAR